MSIKYIRIINEMKVPKEHRNNFGNYNYRNAEDILEALKPICLKENVLPNVTDEIIYVGNRYYIKAVATLTDIEDKTSIFSIGYAREDETKKGMDVAQITGSASSYARKYALNGLLCLDDTKDADYSDNTNKPEKLDTLQDVWVDFDLFITSRKTNIVDEKDIVWIKDLYIKKGKKTLTLEELDRCFNEMKNKYRTKINLAT
jgi:hypothetical protein